MYDINYKQASLNKIRQSGKAPNNYKFDRR